MIDPPANGLTTGNINLYAGNGAIVADSISTSGNVSANYFIGNGSQLTGLPASYGNANVAAYLPTYTGNISAGNINMSGVGNINGYNGYFSNRRTK